MADKSKDESKKSDEEIISLARERFKLCEEAESEVRALALEDLKFRAGEQWPENIKAERDRENRPCLVINRVPQFVRQITNDQRQNRPSIKVSPVDDKADIDTAKIFQGIIRHIEYNSNADVAYDTAFEGAVVKSFGFFRVQTDYVSHDSFEQELLIKPIANHFSTYLDPNSKEPDGSDAEYGFIFKDVPKKDYESENKESDLSNMQDWGSVATQAPGWVDESMCRVAEYFTKEYEDAEIVLLSTDETVLKSKLDEMFPDENLPDGIEIKNTRKTKICTVKHYIINGIEILDRTDWPGKYIPIIPVYGDTLEVDGKVIREGIVRHSKDSQRMYNYWASTETETIALAPKAPWIIANGQITEDNQNIWATANSKSHAFLPYEPIDINGTPIGAPQRNSYEPAVAAITNARMQASEDIKSTTGVYDASLGASSNEKSGIAIQRRNQQSQTSNFHFIDNLTRSLKHTGRILVDLIPKIYDTARVARVIGEDGEQEIVRINEIFEKNGEQKIYDLGAGKYDVTVQTGPSYATKRQEALASMIEMSRAYPQIMQIAGDLLVKNMDWPDADKLQERLKKSMPPELVGDDKDQLPVPPQVQAQMQQMDQMIQQLTQTANEQSEVIKTKTIEIESKERIAFAQIEKDLRIEQMKVAPQEGFLAIAHELAEIRAHLHVNGIGQPIGEEQNQNFNEQSPDQGMPQEQMQQQPTGGQSPGLYTGV